MAIASISEYSAAINTPQMVKASMLIGGSPVKSNGRQIKYSGGFCVVFPYEVRDKKYAVRCWHVNIDDIRYRTKLRAETIQALNLPYFVGFDYVPNGLQTAHGPQDILVMDWVNANSLKSYISKHISQPCKLLTLANNFKDMVGDLHKHHIAHGDLQHGNILVKDDGSLVLVDYDSIYIPSLAGYSDDIKGLAGYQHPARWHNKELNEKVDFFSELIIYTSLLALYKLPQLWNELKLEDTETLLFTAEDIASKGTSQIFQILDDNEDLRSLSSKIKDFLLIKNICDLEPLESIVVSSQQVILSDLSKEWKDNGYVKKALNQADLKNIVKEISKGW